LSSEENCNGNRNWDGNGNGKEKEGPNDRRLSWSRAVRLGIYEHLMMSDIEVPWLMEMIANYRFEAGIEELVEIVRE
jgi:hypothetical protein